MANAQYGDWVYRDNQMNLYNNPNSAWLGTAMNEMRKQSLLDSAWRNSTRRNMQKGAPLKRTPNTVLFAPRTPPLQQWLQTWSGGDAQKRRTVYNEWVVQNAIWKGEIRRLGVKNNDFSQMFALSLLVAYEARSGKKLSRAAFVEVTHNIRDVLLKTQKIRDFSNARKNEFVEQNMLAATNALRLRRQGEKNGNAAQIAEARSASAQFMDEWWNDNGNDLMNRIAAKTSNAPQVAPPAIAKRPASKSTTISFERAVQITNFRRVAPTVLPEKVKISAQKSGQNAAQIESTTRQIIALARQELAANSSEVPVDNVARSMTYAMYKLYAISRSTPGQLLGEGVKLPKHAQTVALRRRLPPTLATNANFKRLNDRQKQELSETLLFVPTFAEKLYQVGTQKDDVQLQTQARDMARAGFQQFFQMAPEKWTF